MSAFLVSFTLLLLMGLYSCAESDISIADNEKNAEVKFVVSIVQDEAMSMLASEKMHTRASFTESLQMLSLVPSDLASRELPATGIPGACFIETTVAGVGSAVQAHTRANIESSIQENFSTIGYRGKSSASVSSEWFHNEETDPQGRLVGKEVLWEQQQPYGKFYGIAPKVDGSKLVLSPSPSDNSETLYVDFEAETSVEKQQDLMTACSGVVHYMANMVHPTTNLAFRHALTAVRFKVGQNLSWNKIITKIEIQNAMCKGRYILPTDEKGTNAEWRNQDQPANFVLGGETPLSIKTAETPNRIIVGKQGDNYTFYMIPQKLSGVTLLVTFSDGTTVKAPLKGEWLPGTTKTYALSEKVSDWKYVLEVVPPNWEDGAETKAAYSVRSYRQTQNGQQSNIHQEAVPWKVVGYQESTGDGEFSKMSPDKPKWLKDLTTKADGSIAEQKYDASAEVNNAYTDSLAIYNKELKSNPQLGTATQPYDLSTKGGGTSNTANCYLVSAPGYYKIPLVYGNAVKNGATNENAYKRSEKIYRYDLESLQDHKGVPITSPYINIQNAGEPATSASVVWTTTEGIVENPEVVGSQENAYVTFHVPKEKIASGNAIVAVKNASGVIMWSWHLWFSRSDALNPVAVTGSTKSFDFATLPLGFFYKEWHTEAPTRTVRVHIEQASSNRGTKQKAYIDFQQTKKNRVKDFLAAYYAFGRKDPYVEKLEGVSFNDELFFDKINQSIQAPGEWGQSDNRGSDFFKYRNLWSVNYPRPEKSIYDPSPVGFRVPEKGELEAFTDGGDMRIVKEDLTERGLYVKTGDASGRNFLLPFLSNVWRENKSLATDKELLFFYLSNRLSYRIKQVDKLMWTSDKVLKVEPSNTNFLNNILPVSE